MLNRDANNGSVLSDEGSIARMSADIASENDTEPGAPTRHVTVNQIVAWNIAWLRREADLKQEELGELLGWPQNKVSEAERSWNGKRTREFDAETLIALAMALEVPVNAFFLPPHDDGQDVTYMIRPAGQAEDRGMGDMMKFAITDTDGDTEIMASYRRRLLGAVGKYLGEGWRSDVARWLRRAVGREAIREGAYSMRGLRASLLALAEDVDAWYGALEQAAGEEEEGE